MDQQTTPIVVFPTKSTFAPRLFEVDAPSGRHYVLRELTTFEQMQADSASTTTAESLYYRVALAIDSIDGERIVPRTKKDVTDEFMRRISGPDGDALVLAYAKQFSPAARAAEIKNESTPSD